MATKLYKQTFSHRPNAAEVHEEIGRRGGVIMRIDQSEAATVAYFEADESLASDSKPGGGKLEEVSMKEVTKV
jgi:hypothetical protein